MFRLLNKSAIWLLCQCVNYGTHYEIRRNYPSLALYFSPLLYPTQLVCLHAIHK